jgi:hypothetical protein
MDQYINHFFEIGIFMNSSLTNGIEWCGDPYDGVSIINIIKIPNSNDVIVLLDNFESYKKNYRNLFRLSTDGRIIWEAKPPLKINRLYETGIKSPDLYVSVTEISEKCIFATSSTTYSDQIDLETGNINDSKWVK